MWPISMTDCSHSGMSGEAIQGERPHALGTDESLGREVAQGLLYLRPGVDAERRHALGGEPSIRRACAEAQNFPSRGRPHPELKAAVHVSGGHPLILCILVVPSGCKAEKSVALIWPQAVLPKSEGHFPRHR